MGGLIEGGGGAGAFGQIVSSNLLMDVMFSFVVRLRLGLGLAGGTK